MKDHCTYDYLTFLSLHKLDFTHMRLIDIYSFLGLVFAQGTSMDRIIYVADILCESSSTLQSCIERCIIAHYVHIIYLRLQLADFPYTGEFVPQISKKKGFLEFMRNSGWFYALMMLHSAKCQIFMPCALICMNHALSPPFSSVTNPNHR